MPLTAIALALAALVPAPSAPAPARGRLPGRRGCRRAAAGGATGAHPGSPPSPSCGSTSSRPVRVDCSPSCEPPPPWPGRRPIAASRRSGTPRPPSGRRSGRPVKTHAPAAWSRTTGDPGMVVAVVDTGVDPGSRTSRVGCSGLRLRQRRRRPRRRQRPRHRRRRRDRRRRQQPHRGRGLLLALPDPAGEGPRVRRQRLHLRGLARRSSGPADHGARVVNTSLGGPLKDPLVAAAAQYARARGRCSSRQPGTTAAPAGYPPRCRASSA